jgi:hypothetical protein
MKTLRKEFKIYRGTYAEVMAAPTEDMAMYLAWDTREIFVGNSLGVKVPYNGGESLTTNQVKKLINDLTESELSQIRSLLTMNNTNYVTLNDQINTTQTQFNSFAATLDSIIAQKANEAIEAIENDPEGPFGDKYYNKNQTEQRILDIVNPVDSKFPNYYTKLELDPILERVNTFADNQELQTFKTSAQEYFSIKTLVNNLTSNGAYSEGNIKTYVVDVLENGIFRILSETDGYSLIIKNNNNISRIGADGIAYTLIDANWVPVIDKTKIVLSVNNILPESNNITLTTDNLSESSTKLFNNILPQTEISDDVIIYENAINPLGRLSGSTVGTQSVSFGYNSKAEELNSIALGFEASATAVGAVQLGTGTNNISNTLKFLGNELVDSNGKIPNERLIERFYQETKTLNFSSLEQDFTFTGMTADALVWVSPAESSFDNYGKFRIRAISQSSNTLRFKCEELPGTSIVVNVTWRI